METKQAGTAAVQGKLWGARAADWAEIQEAQCAPLFEAVLAECRVGARTRMIDIGCGAGLAASMAASRGASVTGFDATPELIAIARNRAPGGDFRTGEMEELPFGDASFDVVTGFNSFQYAASPVAALRQAKRVAKPGGRLVAAVWGHRDDCEAAVYLAALGKFLPPPPPGAPGPFALSEGEALQKLLEDAGLNVIAVRDVACPWTYANADLAARGLLSAGPAVRAIAAGGEEKVREATLAAIEPFKRSNGSYRIENRFRFAVAEI